MCEVEASNTYPSSVWVLRSRNFRNWCLWKCNCGHIFIPV